MTNNASLTYSLTMYDGNINPQNGYFKTDGFALRSIGTRRYPLSYVSSGYYSWGDGNLGNQDSAGYWWSTTASSASSAYALAMDSSGLLPQNNYTKALGFALRCTFCFTFSRRYPLSYVYTEFFDFSGGYIWYQSNGGYYWTQTIYTTGQAYFLVINVGLNPQFYASYSAGMALRSIHSRRYPLSYVFTGDYRWDTSILEHQGDYGGWWSTTTENSASAFFFATVPTSINPTNNWGKISGWALHCITPSVPPSARRCPLSYVYAGGYLWSTGDGRLYNQGVDGQYYSSTAVDDTPSKQYMLLLTSYSNTPQYGNYKIFGFPLRSIHARRYPLSYVFAGQYSWAASKLGNQDEYEFSWSNTAVNQNDARRFFINGVAGLGDGDITKAGGFPLRFILAERLPIGLAGAILRIKKASICI